MGIAMETSSESACCAVSTSTKRVILSLGGKGGVGKTRIIASFTGWFDANDIPIKLLDLDTVGGGEKVCHSGGQKGASGVVTPWPAAGLE